MHFVRLNVLLVLMLASSSAWGDQWSTSSDGMKCVPLRQADVVKLWISSDAVDERATAVEGFMDFGARREGSDAPLLFFEARIRADRPTQNCMRLRWRVEPWGPHPIDAADFGGRFPSGVMDVVYDAHHDEAGGAIQLWVPDDNIRERPETFRIVLLDPVTRTPLAGTIGARDLETGMRAQHRTRQSLNMTSRMVMTVLDKPKPRAK